MCPENELRDRALPILLFLLYLIAAASWAGCSDSDPAEPGDPADRGVDDENNPGDPDEPGDGDDPTGVGLLGTDHPCYRNQLPSATPANVAMA